MSNQVKDVFHAILVKNAEYDGYFEIPSLKPTCSIPQKLIPFSRAIKSNEYDAWVVFYEHDAKFVRVWNQPERYLSVLKKFKGVISPDFSLYRNMPFMMQGWSTYQGKALASFWQENGIDVIPNVRFGDERTFAFCFSGIPKNSVVSVGTHGCIKRKVDREFFKAGLAEMVRILSPQTILVYGAAPDEIFLQYQQQGIQILQFDSDTSTYYKSKQAVV